VQISDNGVGIDKDSLDKIFEPYYTGKSKGNGLGLTNTQNIILNHKGTINVESKLNEGSTFTISLDLAGHNDVNV
jgi:signal transduction histidine kinase